MCCLPSDTSASDCRRGCTGKTTHYWRSGPPTTPSTFYRVPRKSTRKTGDHGELEAARLGKRRDHDETKTLARAAARAAAAARSATASVGASPMMSSR
jgi:hypothetical protein